MIGRSKISSLIADGTWEGSDHSHNSVDDDRRFLFYNFLEYVAHFEPKYFLMENVSGMSSYVWKENGEEVSMIDKIEQSFGALGYSVESRILNAAHFGVPQNRKRVFFLGSRKGEKKPEWPREVDYRISSYQAIQDLGEIDTETGLPLRDKLIPMGECRGGRGVLGFLRYSRRRSVLEGGLASRRWRELTLHRSRPVNPRDIGIFPHLKSGANGEGRILYSDLDPEQISFPPPWRWNKSGGVVWNGRKMGNRRVYKWYDPSKFGDKMRRIRGDMPAPTVVAHLAKDGYMFIHPKENRTISVREAARFQSFPDAFEFRGAVSSQFRQVGNAVPPLLAKAIGEMIRKVI